MAFSKKRLYSKESQVTSAFASALDHPARQKILLILCIDGPCTAEELLKGQPISKSTLSEHLEKLRNMGMISFKERFPHIIYFAERKGIRKAEKYLYAFFRKLFNTDNKNENQNPM